VVTATPPPPTAEATQPAEPTPGLVTATPQPSPTAEP